MKKKVCLYVETVVPEYDNITFRRLFRLKRSSVEILFQEIMAEDSFRKNLFEEDIHLSGKTRFDNSVVPGHTVNCFYDGGQIWRD